MFFVSITWTLEFADHVHSAADPDRTKLFVTPQISLKPHLFTLAKASGVDCTVAVQAGPEPIDPANWQFVRNHRVAPWSPWIIAAAVWYPSLAVALPGLLGAGDLRLWQWGVAAGVVAVLPITWRGGILPQGAAAVMVAGLWTQYNAFALATHGGATARITTMIVLSVLIGLPFLLFLGFYFSSYRSTRGVANRMAAGAWNAVRSAGRSLVS